MRGALVPIAASSYPDDGFAEHPRSIYSRLHCYDPDNAPAT